MAIFNLTYDSTKEAYVSNLSNYYYVVVDFNATSWGSENDKVRLYQSPEQYVHHSNSMVVSRTRLIEDGINFTGSLVGAFPTINFRIINDNGVYSFDENYIPTPQPTPSSDIVNTSISTATLTADTATINQTLTALGINTDLLKTKDLRLVDADGHEHKLHLGN